MRSEFRSQDHTSIRRVDVQCCRPLPRGAFKEGLSCDRARWHVAADAVAQSPGTASIPPPPPCHRLLRHRLLRHPHRLPCSARVGARNRRQTGHHRRGAGQDGSSCREGALPPGHSDRPLQHRRHNLFGLALPAQWRTPAPAPPAISKNTPSLAISLRRWLTKQHCLCCTASRRRCCEGSAQLCRAGRATNWSDLRPAGDLALAPQPSGGHVHMPPDGARSQTRRRAGTRAPLVRLVHDGALSGVA